MRARHFSLGYLEQILPGAFPEKQPRNCSTADHPGLEHASRDASFYNVELRRGLLMQTAELVCSRRSTRALAQ